MRNLPGDFCFFTVRERRAEACKCWRVKSDSVTGLRRQAYQRKALNPLITNQSDGAGNGGGAKPECRGG